MWMDGGGGGSLNGLTIRAPNGANNTALDFFRIQPISLLGHHVSSHTENSFALAAGHRNCKSYSHHKGEERQGLLVDFPPGELVNVSWSIRKDFLIG